MKLNKLFFLGLFTISTLGFIMSCSSNDDGDNNTTETLTEEEAVLIIESSVQKSTAGVNDNAEKFSEELTTNITINLECDVFYEDNFVTNYDSGNIQASYTVDWSYIMTCNDINVPQTISFSYASDGDYTTPRISSTDTSSGSFEISGLQPSESEIVVNGDFIREGVQIVTIINERAVNSHLEIVLNDVIINKDTSSIVSGTGTAILTGASQNTTFLFEGSIVFNGDETATITINGNSYQINLG